MRGAWQEEGELNWMESRRQKTHVTAAVSPSTPVVPSEKCMAPVSRGLEQPAVILAGDFGSHCLQQTREQRRGI